MSTIQVTVFVLVGCFRLIWTSSEVNQTAFSVQKPAEKKDLTFRFVYYVPAVTGLHNISNSRRLKREQPDEEGTRLRELQEFLKPIKQFYKALNAINIAGNILVIAVIIKYNFLQSSAYVYVFSFAVAHLLLSLRMIIDWFRRSEIAGFIAYTFNFIYFTLYFVPNWIIVMISINLYTLLYHPRLSQRYSTPRTALIINCFMWITLIIISNLQMFGNIMFYILFEDYRALSAVRLGPFCITLVLFILIAFKLIFISQSTIQEDRSETGRGISISVAIIVQFLICYGMDCIYKILYLYLYDEQVTYNLFLYEVIYSFINLIFQTINPVIFAVVSQKFRKAYKNLFGLHPPASVPPREV